MSATTMQDQAYLERANGAWELWAYSEDQRIYLCTRSERSAVIAWARHHGYEIVDVT